MGWSNKYFLLAPILSRLDNLKSSFRSSKFGGRDAESIHEEQCGKFGRFGEIGDRFGLRLFQKNMGEFMRAKRAFRSFGGGLKADCCGIVAYMGSGNAQKVLIQGIEILQNRGYDSCGISTINEDGNIVTTKYSSKECGDSLERLKNESESIHEDHHIGIAHTRWATHGGKTDFNAHPHHDYKNRISIVHNGTIDNFASLKSELTKKGIPFQSETDTEVIANLIGLYLDEGEVEEGKC